VTSVASGTADADPADTEGTGTEGTSNRDCIAWRVYAGRPTSAAQRHPGATHDHLVLWQALPDRYGANWSRTVSHIEVIGLALVRRHGILDDVQHATRFFYYGTGSPAAVGRA